MSLSTMLVGSKGPKDISWYRPLFKSTLASAWKHKFLWFFGFFAAVIGSGSEILSIFNSFNRAQEQGPLFENLKTILFSPGQTVSWAGILSTIPQAKGILVAGALLAVLLMFFLFLAVVSQGALVYAGSMLEDAKSPSWKESWRKGLHHFWKLLGVNLMGKILFGAAYMLFALPILFLYTGNSSGILKTLLVLLAFLVVVPLVLLISLFVKLTAIGVVSREEKVRTAFREAWGLVKRHWLVIVEFVILLFLIDVASYLALRLGVAVLAMPFLFAISLFYAFAIPIGASLFYILWILASLLFVLFLSAFVSAFEYLSWVKLYHALLKGSFTPKLVRWVWRFANRDAKRI